MLKLMFITNSPMIADAAESAGVNRIFLDMEYLGKADRQAGLDTVKNHHTIADVNKIATTLKKSELLVRVNPLNSGSQEEINSVIDAGADIIMLPMWKSAAEVEKFACLVGGRAKTVLLLETKEACGCLEDALSIGAADEIHIGLNDLRLSLKKRYIFESLADGTVESLVNRIRPFGIPYGFGGFGMIGEGDVPAQLLVAEHYRLGSSMAILSRSFCNVKIYNTESSVRNRFKNGIKLLRAYESQLSCAESDYLLQKHLELTGCVKNILAGETGV